MKKKTKINRKNHKGGASGPEGIFNLELEQKSHPGEQLNQNLQVMSEKKQGITYINSLFQIYDPHYPTAPSIYYLLEYLWHNALTQPNQTAFKKYFEQILSAIDDDNKSLLEARHPDVWFQIVQNSMFIDPKFATHLLTLEQKYKTSADQLKYAREKTVVENPNLSDTTDTAGDNGTLTLTLDFDNINKLLIIILLDSAHDLFTGRAPEIKSQMGFTEIGKRWKNFFKQAYYYYYDCNPKNPDTAYMQEADTTRKTSIKKIFENSGEYYSLKIPNTSPSMDWGDGRQVVDNRILQDGAQPCNNILTEAPLNWFPAEVNTETVYPHPCMVHGPTLGKTWLCDGTHIAAAKKEWYSLPNEYKISLMEAIKLIDPKYNSNCGGSQQKTLPSRELCKLYKSQGPVGTTPTGEVFNKINAPFVGSLNSIWADQKNFVYTVANSVDRNTEQKKYLVDLTRPKYDKDIQLNITLNGVPFLTIFAEEANNPKDCKVKINGQTISKFVTDLGYNDRTTTGQLGNCNAGNSGGNWFYSANELGRLLAQFEPTDIDPSEGREVINLNVEKMKLISILFLKAGADLLCLIPCLDTINLGGDLHNINICDNDFNAPITFLSLIFGSNTSTVSGVTQVQGDLNAKEILKTREIGIDNIIKIGGEKYSSLWVSLNGPGGDLQMVPHPMRLGQANNLASFVHRGELSLTRLMQGTEENTPAARRAIRRLSKNSRTLVSGKCPFCQSKFSTRTLLIAHMRNCKSRKGGGIKTRKNFKRKKNKKSSKIKTKHKIISLKKKKRKHKNKNKSKKGRK